jgi:hypothetical protein
MPRGTSVGNAAGSSWGLEEHPVFMINTRNNPTEIKNSFLIFILSRPARLVLGADAQLIIQD